MIFNKQALLSELLDRTHLVSFNTQPFLRLPDEQLNKKPSVDKWSIAQVFERQYQSRVLY